MAWDDIELSLARALRKGVPDAGVAGLRRQVELGAAYSKLTSMEAYHHLHDSILVLRENLVDRVLSDDTVSDNSLKMAANVLGLVLKVAPRMISEGRMAVDDLQRRNETDGR